MQRIRKAAERAELPKAEQWLEARIIWIESKLDPSGKTMKEVIYELNIEPDLFRQILIPEDALYPNAKRGDAVLVDADPPRSENIEMNGAQWRKCS